MLRAGEDCEYQGVFECADALFTRTSVDSFDSFQLARSAISAVQPVSSRAVGPLLGQRLGVPA